MTQSISVTKPENGTKVVVIDAEGNHDQVTITNDYVLITEGTCHVSSMVDYPKSGTRQLTVKGLGGRG